MGELPYAQNNLQYQLKQPEGLSVYDPTLPDSTPTQTFKAITPQSVFIGTITQRHAPSSSVPAA